MQNKATKNHQKATQQIAQKSETTNPHTTLFPRKIALQNAEKQRFLYNFVDNIDAKISNDRVMVMQSSPHPSGWGTVKKENEKVVLPTQ